MKIEPIEGSETSAILNQTPGNYPKGNLLYSVNGESLKSRITCLVYYYVILYFYCRCFTLMPYSLQQHKTQP